MRFFSLVALLATCMMAAVTACAHAATRSIVLRADVVDYYSNRFILTADGHVHAQLSDGTVITGQTFAMDLKLNRFVIAGDVHVDGPSVHEVGAAFSDYPDLDRIYFLTNGDEPDRWTFFGSDYKNRHAGREQPGDAFYLPDLHDAPPYLVGNRVTIFPKNNIEFAPGTRIRIAGLYTPTPGWVVNFSANSNFYQNGYAGAVFDVQIPFVGSENAITAFDVRYDQTRGAYLSFEQHLVHDRDYYVFTINPLTQDQRQWDLIAYKRISPALETRVFGQLSTLSTWPFKEPSQSSSYVNFQLNSRVGRYAVSLNADQYNNSLIPSDNSAFTPYGLRVDGHPFDVQLSVQSFEDEWKLFRSIGVPLKFQYRAGYGWAYDSFGILAVNGQPTFNGGFYPLISQTFVGATVYTSPIRLFSNVTISAKSDKQRQWFSLPHHIDTTNTSVTLAYAAPLPKLPSGYLSYQVLNIADYYGAQQLIAYPPADDTYVSPYGFGTFTGLAAFRGLATQRVLTGSGVYSPNPNLSLSFIMQYYNVTPAPVPGLGGLPPFELTPDARFRITPNLQVDISRTYYFHFGVQNWSTQANIVLSP